MKNTLKEMIWTQTIDLFYKESASNLKQISKDETSCFFDKRIEELLLTTFLKNGKE